MVKAGAGVGFFMARRVVAPHQLEFAIGSLGAVSGKLELASGDEKKREDCAWNFVRYAFAGYCLFLSGWNVSPVV